MDHPPQTDLLNPLTIAGGFAALVSHGVLRHDQSILKSIPFSLSFTSVHMHYMESISTLCTQYPVLGMLLRHEFPMLETCSTVPRSII